MDKQKVEKAYLLDQIDMAIIKAKAKYDINEDGPKVYIPDYLEFNFKQDSVQFGTMILKLDNGCSFTIVNTKESLLKFRKIAERKFPGTMATLNKLHPEPKYPSLKRRGNLNELIINSNLIAETA